MRISDWSSDVCSSDLILAEHEQHHVRVLFDRARFAQIGKLRALVLAPLDRTAELRERQHRHIEILGQRLEPAADFGDFLHAIVAAAAPRAREQMKIIDHHRSEERRVGKAWVSTCRYRWSPSDSEII